jgi:hypothetical protein
MKNKLIEKNYLITNFILLMFVFAIGGCTKEDEPIPTTSGYCFASNFGGLGQLFKTSSNQQLDYWHYGEYNNLVQRFGVAPDIYFYDDGTNPNAYFTPQISNNQYPDGQVAIGLNWIKKEFANSPTNSGVSIAIIMAHEFGHCVDAKYNVYSSRNHRNELFADYLAGCYLHLKSMTIGEQYVSEVANSFYSIGDYQFNDPSHHGTPQQRVSCLMAGYNFSKSKVGVGYGITEAITNAKNYVTQF